MSLIIYQLIYGRNMLSPVRQETDYSTTLQYRSARDGNDEIHICPLEVVDAI